MPGLWRDSLHVTCGLTACTPGSAPGPTLGNEYGKTLLYLYHPMYSPHRQLLEVMAMGQKVNCVSAVVRSVLVADRPTAVAPWSMRRFFRRPHTSKYKHLSVIRLHCIAIYDCIIARRGRFSIIWSVSAGIFAPYRACKQVTRHPSLSKTVVSPNNYRFDLAANKMPKKTFKISMCI